MPVVIDIADAMLQRSEAERKARRAQRERERYAAKREEEQKRCRAAKQQQRGGTRAARPSYDPQDYAEEFAFLTAMGVRADQIIERSSPSRDWFDKHILPLVRRALCVSCWEPFSPQQARSLTRCSKTCGFQRVPADEAW